MEEWITVKEAARIRKCTDRNILKLIKKGDLQGKKDGRRWLVLMEIPEHNTEQYTRSEELLSLIKAQLQEKDDQIRKLQEQLVEKDRQIERLQQLLERQLLPFWKRRRGKRLPEPGSAE